MLVSFAGFIGNQPAAPERHINHTKSHKHPGNKSMLPCLKSDRNSWKKVVTPCAAESLEESHMSKMFDTFLRKTAWNFLTQRGRTYCDNRQTNKQTNKQTTKQSVFVQYIFAFLPLKSAWNTQTTCCPNNREKPAKSFQMCVFFLFWLLSLKSTRYFWKTFSHQIMLNKQSKSWCLSGVCCFGWNQPAALRFSWDKAWTWKCCFPPCFVA